MQQLTTETELDDCLEKTAETPAFIFKHSTACPTSAFAYKRVANYIQEKPDFLSFYLVHVIESRPISNAITARLNVPHQSPQLLLVKGDTVIWDTSHAGITEDAIKDALKNSKIL